MENLYQRNKSYGFETKVSCQSYVMIDDVFC
jgi:hypothetical protein